MAKDQSKRTVAKEEPRRGWMIAVVAVALVAAAGVYLAWRTPDRGAATSAEPVPQSGTTGQLTRKMVLPAIPRRPRPATLAPEEFTEPSTRKSYEVARKNPDLLEQMACYCGCYSNPGHTNNLDCFVDKHGET